MNDVARSFVADNVPSAAHCCRLAAVCAASATFLAVLTLVGWVPGSLILAQWHPSYLPMAPSMALGFALLGTGLFVCVRWPQCGRWFAAIVSLLVVGLTGLMLAGFWNGFDWTLEHLLFNHPQRINGMVVGISPLTAAALLLAGTSLALLTPAPVSAGRHPRTSLAGTIAVGVTAVGAIHMLSYLYGTPLLYGGSIIPVSLPAAVAALLIGMGLLTAAGTQAWPLRLLCGASVGARMSRALLPVILILILAGNWIASGLRHAGFHPVLGEAIESLISITALGAVTLFIARRVGGDIDRVEASRRNSEERFRLFYQASPVPYQTMDMECHLIDVNQAYLDAMGYARKEEVLGRWCGEFLSEISGKALQEDFPTYLKQGVVRQVEMEAVRRDGSHMDILVDASLGDASDGAFQQIHCVWSDITERKRALLALTEAKAVAEAATHAKDHLLATVSHELRTPLTPVLVTLSMMQEDPQVPSVLLPDIAMMRSRIELEAKLIDGLLDLTRMTRGKLKLKPELVDAHALLDHALVVAVQDADAFRPAIHWELNAAEHFVWADPIRLQQVCWNILKNALQYTPDNGIVHIRSRNTVGGMLELEFADTGAGIDPEFLPRIFNEFERGPHGRLHRAGGLGLGMSIAKSLIEQLGGSVEAASGGPGQGATFTVRLPIVKDEWIELPTEPSTPAHAHAPADAAVPALRILLVEDDADTTAALCRVLRHMGYHVTIAATVAEALAAGAREKFDLLLCDIGLPDGSGLDVMRWFGKNQSIPGIALSGYAAPADLERSCNVGFAMHLIKPIAMGALRAAIQEVHASTSKAQTGSFTI